MIILRLNIRYANNKNRILRAFKKDSWNYLSNFVFTNYKKINFTKAEKLKNIENELQILSNNKDLKVKRIIKKIIYSLQIDQENNIVLPEFWEYGLSSDVLWKILNYGNLTVSRINLFNEAFDYALKYKKVRGAFNRLWQ